ncbi:MAG: TetR/AcrR family transcriptional regulator [Lachnospiraceae bacterium]
MANKIKMKQKRTVQTRYKIIDSAMELISEQGYFAVTTNDVAKQAGISIGSLYSHFKDKKELMIACVEHYYELVGCNIDTSTIDQPMENNTSFITHLSATIKSVFIAHQTMPSFHRAMMAACLQDPDINAIDLEKNEVSKQRVLSLLENWKEVIKPVDIIITAEMIYLLVSETVHKHIHGEITHTKEELIAELTKMIQSYLFS